MIEFVCECGRVYQLDDALAGKKVQCADCGRRARAGLAKAVAVSKPATESQSETGHRIRAFRVKTVAVVGLVAILSFALVQIALNSQSDRSEPLEVARPVLPPRSESEWTEPEIVTPITPKPVVEPTPPPVIHPVTPIETLEPNQPTTPVVLAPEEPVAPVEPTDAEIAQAVREKRLLLAIQTMQTAAQWNASGDLEKSHAALLTVFALQPEDPQLPYDAWQQSDIPFEKGLDAYRSDLFRRLQISRGLVLDEGEWQTPEQIVYKRKSDRIHQLLAKAFLAYDRAQTRQKLANLKSATRTVKAIEKFSTDKAYDRILASYETGSNAKQLKAKLRVVKEAYMTARGFLKVNEKWYSTKGIQSVAKPKPPWKNPLVRQSKYYIIQAEADPAFMILSGLVMDKIFVKFQNLFDYRKTPKKKLKIKIFKTQKQYMIASHAGPGIVGHFSSTENEIVTFIENNDLFGTLFHEATHQFTYLVFRKNYRTIPSWFVEGLAVYFENTRVTGDTITVGAIPSARLFEVQQALRKNTHIPIQEILNANDLANHGGMTTSLHYAEAWSMVHWLITSSPKTRKILRNFVTRMRKGEHGMAAFRRAFRVKKGQWDTLEKLWKKSTLNLKAH